MSKSLVIARPYAKAIFALAVEQQTLAAWSALLQVASYTVQTTEVQALLADPSMSAQRLYDFLTTVCQAQLTRLGENFLKLLQQRNRFQIIPQIAELFEIYKAQQQKLAKVQVTSALPLNDAEQTQLTQQLQKRLQRSVILEYAVDPSLLGGMVIQADDLVIDGSIRSKLARLRAQLQR